MARLRNRPVRKEAHRRTTTSPHAGVGDSDRVRLPRIWRGKSEPTTKRQCADSVDRAKADFRRRIRNFASTRGRVSREADIRFQPIVSSYTHERIRAARRRLKHEPFNPSVDIPRAVAVDFNKVHACDCGAYLREVVKNGKRKKNRSGVEREIRAGAKASLLRMRRAGDVENLSKRGTRVLLHKRGHFPLG